MCGGVCVCTSVYYKNRNYFFYIFIFFCLFINVQSPYSYDIRDQYCFTQAYAEEPIINEFLNLNTLYYIK